MKNLLIIVSLSFVFACHTKEEQAKSGANDPINLIYHDIDSSVVSFNGPQTPEPAPVVADTASDSGACIDSSRIQPDAMCTQEYQPVCGCDGKEYSNQCEAEKAGVTKFTEGPCEAKKEEKNTPKKDSKKDSKKKKKK